MLTVIFGILGMGIQVLRKTQPIHICQSGSYMVALQAINSICMDDNTYEVQLPLVGIECVITIQ